MVKKNIIFIYFDQARYDLILDAEKKLNLPNIEALAKDGFTMERAYCSTPLCVPSRTSMFSSRYASYSKTGMGNAITLNENDTTLPSELKKAGYTLAIFGKNHAFLEEAIQTWDFVEEYDLWGKETHPYCSPLTEGEKKVREWRMDRSVVPPQEGVVWSAQPGGLEPDPQHMTTNYAIRFLKERDPDKPFFMYYSFESPHFPYVVPEPYYSLFPLSLMPGRQCKENIFEGRSQRLWAQYYGQNFHLLNDEDYKRMQASYAAQLCLLDYEIGRMITALKEEGLYDDAVIVFQSDHGDFYGYKGLMGKTNSLYEDLIHVPVVIKLPGYAGRRSRAMMSNIDIAPTILDYLGLPIPEDFMGKSFIPHFKDRQEKIRDCILAEARVLPLEGMTPDNALRSVINTVFNEKAQHGWHAEGISGWIHAYIGEDNYKIIVNENDIMEMYDLNTDPMENNNLAMNPKYHSKLKEMLDKIEHSQLYLHKEGD